MENAKSAYKDTLYLHEWFDEDLFIAETTPDSLKSLSIDTELRAHSIGKEDDDFIIKVQSAYVGGSAMMVYMGNVISGAGFFGRITATIFRGAGILGLAISIVGDLGHTGYFIYMKATNPDLQFMAVEE
jgi:hypothetical protein